MNSVPDLQSPTTTQATVRIRDVVVSKAGTASWYLDPLVAAQKRKLNAGLLHNRGLHSARLALKTDSFEEAFGEDSPMTDILPFSRKWLVMDRATSTVERAQARMARPSIEFFAGDAMDLPLETASLDLVFSNSTLDHFESHREFDVAIHEIGRVLSPRGCLILTTDNPLNPLYWPLRWMSQTSAAPFSLGYTPSPWRLRTVLEQAGFEVTGTGLMIHNPRGVSTLLFLLLRRLLGAKADGPISVLLRAFEQLDRLPTRHITGCFQIVWAVRRDY